MTYRRTEEDLLYPSRVLYQLLNDYIDGRLNLNRVFYRARVEEVGANEGDLESSPPSPAGSIRARVYTYGLDATIPSDALTIFYPFFSNGEGPTIEVGEHVYVVFEDENFSSGLWVSKIPNFTDVNFSDPDILSETTSPTAAQKFEGQQPQSKKQPLSSKYGGVSTVSSEQKRVVNTYELQEASFWQGKRVLHIGDSTVATVYGKVLGETLQQRYGASFYIDDGRVSWGVRHWVSGRFTGNPNSTNKTQGPNLKQSILLHSPDIVIINLGGNDFSRASSPSYQNEIQSLLSQLGEVNFFWVGPVKVFEGRLISSERLQTVRRGRDTARNKIRTLVGNNKFIDASTVAQDSAGRRDGVHFASNQAGKRSARELVDKVARFPL